MDTLRRFLVGVFGVILAITFPILVMIHGWGLEPKSWWWIIGVGFCGQIVAQIIIKSGIDKY